MKQKRAFKPVALIIVDGWGIGDSDSGNALKCVPTPHLDELAKVFPTTRLACSGEAVGLKPGQMGDSNVGHLNIGAGRVVYQDLVRIDKIIANKEFELSATWQELISRLQSGSGRLHLFGLLSNGGVHSHIEHLKEILLACKRAGVNPFIHAQLDGRDVSPTSGVGFIRELEAFIQQSNIGQLATVMGRYYGMDRDKRWERTELAYKAIVYGQGKHTHDAAEEVLMGYNAGVFDEFVEPLVMDATQPHAQVKDGDEILFFNFRSDRMRQIVQAFNRAEECGFDLNHAPHVNITTFTQYHRSYPFPYLFPPQNLANTLGEIVSRHELRQLRLAETEKYAHVTFFFNGGRDAPFAGEDRVMIPSPKVATYDLQPEMSAHEVTAAFLQGIENGFDLIVMNYANLDMVGHTGNFSAACKAVEVIDQCVGRAVQAVLEAGGAAVITADHGNAEKMVDDTGDPYTAHTLNPVSLIMATKDKKITLTAAGILADIAPTILKLLQIEPPTEMTGRSLIEEDQ